MSHSYAQRVPLAYTRCGRPFDAAIWLIVDAAERPDLLERMRAGSLHDVVRSKTKNLVPIRALSYGDEVHSLTPRCHPV